MEQTVWIFSKVHKGWLLKETQFNTQIKSQHSINYRQHPNSFFDEI